MDSVEQAMCDITEIDNIEEDFDAIVPHED